MIKSPFNKDQELVEAVNAVVKLAGYDEYFIAFTQAGPVASEYSSFSSIISDGMIEYLRQTADYMEERLNDEI